MIFQSLLNSIRGTLRTRGAAPLKHPFDGSRPRQPLDSPRPLTFAEAIPKFLASREARGVRWATQRNYEIFCRAVEREWSPRTLDSLTRDEFRQIVATRSNNFAQAVKVLMAWAFATDLVPANVTAGKIGIDVMSDAVPPIHFTPAEAQRYYACVSEPYKPAFALAMFAGIRPYEVCRMDWQSINVKERRIRIEPSVSKIRRARMIEDVPTILWAQLALFEQREGRLIPACSIGPRAGEVNCWAWQKERCAAAKQANVKLGHDILRHSFATYFVAYTGSTARAAKILGHCDLRMLAQHYDGTATKQDAESYFHPKPILALPCPQP